MARRLIDLTGKRFGSWTVICRGEDYISFDRSHSSPRWICRCECGNMGLVFGGSLRSGQSTCCHKCRDEKRIAGLRNYHRANSKLKGMNIYG